MALLFFSGLSRVGHRHREVGIPEKGSEKPHGGKELRRENWNGFGIGGELEMTMPAKVPEHRGCSI